MSFCLSLKILSFNNINKKLTTIIQRDSLNNLFKTNHEIEFSLLSKLAKNIKVENKDIIKT